MDREIINLFILLNFPGFGPRIVRRIRDNRGDLNWAESECDFDEWRKIGIKKAKISEWTDFYRCHGGNLTDTIKMAEKSGINFLPWWDDSYPILLREIYQPPPLLCFRGDIDILKGKCLAMVGTRRMTSYGRLVIKRLVPAAVSGDWVVVSGLAYGVDGLVHRETIKAGGLTVAVIGGSLDKVYPAGHAGLAEEIIRSGGLLISEQVWKILPEPWHFPLRNRIISGLCQKILVVEAPSKSGAKITARLGLEQNRQVMAIPGQIFNVSSAGCNELIKEGAMPIISDDDWLVEMGISEVRPGAYQPEDVVEKTLLEKIEAGLRWPDQMQTTDLLPEDILTGLNKLQLKGVVIEVGGCWELKSNFEKGKK